MKNIKIAGITKESVVDGEGYRYVIFVQGCAHACPGCQNQDTWDFKGGTLYTPDKQISLIDEIIEDPILDGITLSGGDPFYQAEACAEFVQELRNKTKELTVWAYTGFVWEELIKSDELLKLAKCCDVIIDGPFLESQKSLDIQFRGSRNQRIIDVRKSLELKKAVEYQI